MSFRNLAFQRAFSKMFVYNILFEDSESDERYLGVNEHSSVLSITGAGCGVASMMSRHPQRLDAVDINRHHLALAGLKVLGAQGITEYDTFYQLLGRGSLGGAEQIIQGLSDQMPSWMGKYWRKHAQRFEKGSIYLQGLTSRMLTAVRLLSEMDASWLLDLVDATVEEREKAIDEAVRPLLRRRSVRMVMKSPLQLLALGINFHQRDKILATEDDDNLLEFFVSHLKRLARTDLSTNWFVWYAVAGHFNHGNPDAVPPYLRRDRHERSTESPTSVHFHHGNIFDRLESAGTKTWSHYTLCDAPDWMPPKVQKRLLDEIFRTSQDGAVVLARSVEEDSFIDRIDQGRRFKLIEDASAKATVEDRSRQYRRVDFFRVEH